MTLLNTGMTRDGLFLIENGEIVAPVQNSAEMNRRR
jgi:predicted Zn-dependent protease